MNEAWRIHIIPKAVSASEGRREILACSCGTMGTFCDALHPEAPRSLVDCIRLDDWMDEWQLPRIDFLKMDVEGAEAEILFSLRTLAWSRIRKIALEYHDHCFGEHELLRRNGAAGFEELLDVYGFRTAKRALNNRYGFVWGWRP